MLAGQDDATQKISVDVNIPADAIIGRYKLTVEVTSELETGMKTERTTKPDIIVIFNPFSPADDCFMENPSHRNEYVLNDVGLLYRGGWYDFSGKEWAFGQFDEGILDITLKLLRVDSRATSNPERSLLKRTSPVFCSRVLSAMVNNFDAKGVIFGDWSGNYEGGKRPTFWSGSAKILQEWNKTNMPVKYGQCWVFAGVLTTVMRAIGIACRPITNFRSAHDMEYNMTIDEFYEEDGSKSEVMNSGDSIWNFHVWNEGYFRRPDLPKGYNGWQAVDGTPQEASNHLMQCGPAPVSAIKNGEIYIGHDTNFIFAEVNADVLEWQVDKQGQVTALLRRNTRDVGRKLSTKAVGSNEREDLTDRYKYEEGSSDERKAFERAYAHGRKADYHEKLNVIKDEGAITISHETIGEVINGKTIKVAAKVTNTTSQSRDVIITTVMHTVLNTGARRGLVARERIEVKLDAGEVSQKTFSLDFSQYSSQLVDENAVRVTTTVRVQQTSNLYVGTYDFQVKSPDCLKIKCADKLANYEYSSVQLVITNPLPVALTTGEFSIEGSGFYGASVKAVGPIAPGETYTSEVMEIRPYRRPNIQLLADFDAREIMNIKASKTVEVE
uniref:protein-glutamine gamma-glutamyltransferase n=1 Tax=Phallusia mammillata TaxID=59560 RepID=A0A6F9DV96_9ASCI|nr:transglutaminase [Phallusia mammillata]